MPKEIEYAVKGYHQFRQKYFGEDKKIFNQLKYRQTPKILVIACSDSRVDPAIILNCEPGDLFVVRNVANLIPPYENDDSTYHGTSAALEFGILGLEIRHVIIFGHSKCGGINALVENPKIIESKKFVAKWIKIAEPARDEVLKNHSDLSGMEKVDCCAKYSIINSKKNLLTFPWVKERIDYGNLFLHGWYFDISTGKIEAYDQASNQFKELKE